MYPGYYARITIDTVIRICVMSRIVKRKLVSS